MAAAERSLYGRHGSNLQAEYRKSSRDGGLSQVAGRGFVVIGWGWARLQRVGVLRRAGSVQLRRKGDRGELPACWIHGEIVGGKRASLLNWSGLRPPGGQCVFMRLRCDRVARLARP